MERKVNEMYEKYDAKRKQYEAAKADEDDLKLFEAAMSEVTSKQKY